MIPTELLESKCASVGNVCHLKETNNCMLLVLLYTRELL